MRFEPLAVIHVSRELLDAQVLGLDFPWLSEAADGGDTGISFIFFSLKTGLRFDLKTKNSLA